MFTNGKSADKFFVKPYEFIPERWDSQPELIIERRGFFPFNGGTHKRLLSTLFSPVDKGEMRSVINKIFLTGRWSCVGQKLAMMTMRMFLAYTLWNYDFGFAPSEDGVAVHRDALNMLIVRPGNLELVFHKR